MSTRHSLARNAADESLKIYRRRVMGRGGTSFDAFKFRTILSYPDRARLDLEYVGTRSVWMDMKLLLLTVPAVLQKRGAF